MPDKNNKAEISHFHCQLLFSLLRQLFANAIMIRLNKARAEMFNFVPSMSTAMNMEIVG